MERTEWSAYEQKAPDVTNPEFFVEKQRPAYEVLQRIGSGSLLDIGCNKGWYSLLAESMGFRVVSIDIDLESLTILYKKVKREQRHILPLYVDFCEPTGANGLGGTYPDFMHRMKCDVVFAMAIIHHLAYKPKLSFEVIANRIAQLTRKVAVVEFIPREDIYVSKWNQDGMDWYTRENFVEAFMRHFNHMETFPSTPLPREVFVFDKVAPR
jgi:2-polyprenyl-3-methyl-5-hydroxy-6-metoxy-1,4-benzoquinol methylase